MAGDLHMCCGGDFRRTGRNTVRVDRIRERLLMTPDVNLVVVFGLFIAFVAGLWIITRS
jgi:hypothetical protein